MHMFDTAIAANDNTNRDRNKGRRNCGRIDFVEQMRRIGIVANTHRINSAGFLVTGCSKMVQAAQKSLTIGGIAFLTGPASQGGIACKQGWELVVDKYNKAGPEDRQ